MSKSDVDTALEALARAEGKTVEELKRELLKDRLSGSTALAGPERREPTTSRRREDNEETPEEARERWLAEEAMLPDGVLSAGGQSAGGIFGSGPIATETYDPMAFHRSASVARDLKQIEAAEAQSRTMKQLGDTVEALAEHIGLPRRLGGGGLRGLLGGRRRPR